MSLGFRVQGSGLRVWGAGCGVMMHPSAKPWEYNPMKDDRSDFTLWGYNPTKDDRSDFE